MRSNTLRLLFILSVLCIFAHGGDGNSTSTTAAPDDDSDDKPTRQEIVRSYIFLFLLFIIMIAMGTGIEVQVLLDRIKTPKAVAIAWIHQFCILPFCAYLLAEAFSMPSVYAVALKLQSMCPGGSTSNILCYLGMTDVPTSIACTTLSTISALFMMPLWIFVYLPDEDSIEFSETIPSIIQSLAVVLIGTGVGMYLGKNHPVCANRLQKFASPVLLLLIVIVVLGIVVGGTSLFGDDPDKTLPATFLLPWFGALSAMTVATLTGVPKEQRLACAIETSVQNQALALAIVQQVYTGDEANQASTIPVLYTLFGGTANWSLIGWCYYMGWSYADPEKNFCENLISANEMLKAGTDAPAKQAEAHRQSQVNVLQGQDDAGDAELAESKREPDTVDNTVYQ